MCLGSFEKGVRVIGRAQTVETHSPASVVKAKHLLGLSLLVGTLVGCQSTQPKYQNFTAATGVTNSATSSAFANAGLTNRIEAAWLQPAADLFTLGPGDRLEVEVLGEPASRATTVVAPDGMPLAGCVAKRHPTEAAWRKRDSRNVLNRWPPARRRRYGAPAQ